MKSKDQTLLEEAYKTIVVKENEEESSLDKWHDKKVKEEENISSEEDLKNQYFQAFKNLENDKVNTQQFGDICAKILGELWGNELPSPKLNPSVTGEDFEREDRGARSDYADIGW